MSADANRPGTDGFTSLNYLFLARYFLDPDVRRRTSLMRRWIDQTFVLSKTWRY